MTYTIFGQFDDKICTPLFPFKPPRVKRAVLKKARPKRLSAIQIEKCNLVVIMIAEHFDVPIKEIMSKTRARASAPMARQTAIYLAHTLLSVSYKNTAQYFGRDRTTVAYACRTIEDHRDNLIFDAKLIIVENTIQSAVNFIGGHTKELVKKRKTSEAWGEKAYE